MNPPDDQPAEALKSIKPRTKTAPETPPHTCQPPDFQKVSPSAFMRARRPHLFSDTTHVEHASLDRAVFDHHLDTLTSRKQELSFERFARKLAEKEICPNLIPQTGPTGGGDSKVDSETYPVSPEIANRWYDGEPRSAAEERWAFAFSTKKDWKAKVKSDIASIASTGRGYVRVYFITSRYVRDKDRSATEDQLSKQFGFDVRILDRTWIIEKIFANKREQLAIDTLELQQPLVLHAPVKGPYDTRREAELEELEQQIADVARYRGIEYQLVEDCLEAALLARGLERPRIEVDGRFERAARIAEQYGTTQQQLRVGYNRAWTLYWWYEDFSGFDVEYNTVERLAKRSPQLADIDLLRNLWNLLFVAVREGNLNATKSTYIERTATLRKELDRLASETSRPATALGAKGQLLLMDLIEAGADIGERHSVLAELKSVFTESKGLVDFPTRELIDLVMELGKAFPLDDAFDELFEVVLPIAQERESNVTAGRMLLHRGMQKLENAQPYEAIRLLGRAQQLLSLRESRDELVAALALCAQAYEAAGLLWAARESMLVAAGQATNDFWEDGSFTKQAYACLRRLAWLELQLGRVPCALAWVETAAFLSRTLNLNTTERESLRDEWMNFDFALGVLLLNTEFFDLKQLTSLPTVLDRLGLNFSWVALLYALGHEDTLRECKALPEEESQEAVRATFSSAVAKLEASDLPQKPDFLDRRKVELHSSVLGCSITVEVANGDKSLFLAEAILGTLEAFLATSLGASSLLPYSSKLEIKVTPSDFLSKPLEWKVVENEGIVEVLRSTTDNLDAHALHDLLPELVITIMTLLAVPTDLAHFEKLFRDEQAMGRAVYLVNAGASLGNILGRNPKLRLRDWAPEDGESAFPLRRTEVWNFSEGLPATESRREQPAPGSGDPPRELLDTERLKHPDRKVFSFINIPLWSKAAWKGVGFLSTDDPSIPPVLIILFDHKASGESIFAAWRREIGPQDDDGKLRIVVVTGIDRANPAHYRVIIGSGHDWKSLRQTSQWVDVSRIHTMTPSTSENLDRFISAFKTAGRFALVPGHMEPGETFPRYNLDLAILSTRLNLRPAWEIAEHDPDIVGIQDGDQVIIPDGVKDPPVLRTLERIPKRRTLEVPEEFLAAQPSKAAKVGRNDPCPCGSGKKFKKCHGRPDA